MDLDGLSSLSSLQALADLLNPKQEEDDNDGEDEVMSAASVAKQGPGHIGPSKKQETKVLDKVTPQITKDIWDEEGVPEGSEFEDCWDTRERPEYEIIFKQRVTTEDIFLGMSRKDPSTACCEDMLIKINLPGTKTSDITVDIKEKFLDLRTPKYKLGLHLPHPVDSKNGNARFISEQEVLEVTVGMKRDLDFINFA